MKILHTADWHIGQFKGPVVDGVNLRSQDTVNCLNYMIKVAEEEKPDIVCVSGDVFHQEQIGPVRYSDEMIVATDTITKLAGVAKAVIVMRGTPNHDGGGQFRVLSKMFANTGNVHIVTSPTVLRTPYADIACIPGFDKQEFRSRFPGLSADEENEAWTSYISSMVMGLRAECHNTSILMAHYTVPGCNMESGQTSFFTNFEPVIPREALEAAGYEAVLLGHIHRPQQINGLHNVYYSGAINAMNFNDEHQNRGFYIHEFMGGEMTSSQFCGTPYRRFKTIDWDTNQVSDYIGNRDAYALVTNISRDISDMIVRVKYSCTSEQKKLLNIPLLQKDLYDWGAFYVSDIEAENAIDVTNRGLLSEESDPTLNLKKYLEEKCFKNPDKIVELAEPIIAEAMKQSTTAEIHGVFRPISIAVRNYRNYKEEISSKTQILENCNVALESANEVRKKAAEYKQLSEQIIELEKDVLNHDNAKRNLAGYNADIQNCQNIINDAKRRNNDIANLIEQLKAELPDNLEEKLTELAQVRTQCEKLQEKRYLTSVAEQELQQIRATYSQRISEAENRRKYRLDRISEIRQQEEFMKNSGCPDIDGASCRFLAKAIDDVKSLPEEADHLEKCEEEIAALRTKRDEEISKKQDEICIIGYDAEKLDLLTVKASTLVKYENLKKDAEKKKLEIARLETEKDTNSKTIGQCEESLLELNIKAQKATDIVDALSDSVIKHDDAVCKRNSVAHFAEQEKELPVYEERKQHIDKRLTELYQERSKEDANELVLYNNLREAEIELKELRKDIEGSEALEEVERRLKSAKETLEKAQIQKGVLTQRVEDVEAMRSEIALLNKGIAVAAEKADCYEALKQAFSQDGVPHQIIRNIIPHITDTANNILGSMTGGTMGVEFVMERTVKGKDGDRATLDVLINEYGKTTLPYASKSGGEKVKASLAIILALSEIKATSAGIQLGMLFIDEPPFLDDDGTQAYVDALETIRQRYPDVKIMAITHDDAMKARFGQAVTVIKTDDGSKVIY